MAEIITQPWAFALASAFVGMTAGVWLHWLATKFDRKTEATKPATARLRIRIDRDNGHPEAMLEDNVYAYYVTRQMLTVGEIDEEGNQRQHHNFTGCVISIVPDSPIETGRLHVSIEGETKPAWEIKEKNPRLVVLVLSGATHGAIVDFEARP